SQFHYPPPLNIQRQFLQQVFVDLLGVFHERDPIFFEISLKPVGNFFLPLRYDVQGIFKLERGEL
ncbi:hypothetical protein LTR66_015981, partial [Elasticomyces elasticus]